MVLIWVRNYVHISGLGIQDWLAGRADKALKSMLLQIMDPKADDTLLDVGGGTGRLAEVFAGTCREVWVLDLERRKLQFGMERRKNVSFIQSTVEHIPFGDGYFRKVMTIVTFHHFPDADIALKEICRVIKPHGLLELDPRTTEGKMVNFFENTLSRHNCTFYTPLQLQEKVSQHGHAEISIVSSPKDYFVKVESG